MDIDMNMLMIMFGVMMGLIVILIWWASHIHLQLLREHNHFTKELTEVYTHLQEHLDLIKRQERIQTMKDGIYGKGTDRV